MKAIQVLVVNGGSSSVKFSVYRVERGGAEATSEFQGEASGIATGEAAFSFKSADGSDVHGKAGSSDPDLSSMHGAMKAVAEAVVADGIPDIGAVGYRVVHPGARMKGHQRITREVLKQLRQAGEFAPLHDPEAIEVIEAMMRRFPKVPHVACFDTVFHETMPAEATTYALPRVVRDGGVRRYGFHGLSCESVVEQMRAAPGLGVPRRMVIAHLGSGCSVTAVVDGQSVDTSMGLTPTGGVVMGTRPGDLDPGVVLYLLRQPGATVDSVEAMLNHDSGLKGLAGKNDMRAVAKAAKTGDESAGLAIRIFQASVKRAVGGMMALYGMEALVFTGGIGEHDAGTRLAVGTGLNPSASQAALIDSAANESEASGLRRVSEAGASYAVYVVPAEEDWMIARHVGEMVGAG